MAAGSLDCSAVLNVFGPDVHGVSLTKDLNLKVRRTVAFSACKTGSRSLDP